MRMYSQRPSGQQAVVTGVFRSPPGTVFIFIAHRVRHSHFSAFMPVVFDLNLPTHALALSARQYSARHSPNKHYECIRWYLNPRPLTLVKTKIIYYSIGGANACICSIQIGTYVVVFQPPLGLLFFCRRQVCRRSALLAMYVEYPTSSPSAGGYIYKYI